MHLRVHVTVVVDAVEDRSNERMERETKYIIGVFEILIPQVRLNTLLYQLSIGPLLESITDLVTEIESIEKVTSVKYKNGLPDFGI